MRWSRETRKRLRGGEETPTEKKKEATHGAKVAGEATFLLLREISYSPNACLELCGAGHMSNGKVLLTAVTMSLGDLGEAMAKNRP